MELDRLIVLDGVSGLADRSDTFAIFLTVSQKFGRTCIYVFHKLYLTRQNWQLILAQTKIFNIFPGSLQTSLILKILSSFCSRYIGVTIYRAETFALIGYTLAFQIPVKNNV